MGAMQQSMIMASSSTFTPVTRTYTTGTAATETAPAGATNVIIAVWGAGGGGTRAPFVMCIWDTGDSGGSGAYSQSTYAITSGQTLTYTVGVGGQGGEHTPTVSATDGTASSVSSGTKTITTMTANGGKAGFQTAATASGGTTTNTSGDVNGPAITGWNSNSGGQGGDPGFGFEGNATDGDTGKVIFYYT